MDFRIVSLLCSVILGVLFLSFEAASNRYQEAPKVIPKKLRSINLWDLYNAASDNDLVNIDDFLLGIIENFKEDMVKGIPELKLPILDPFEPPEPIEINVKDDSAVVHANFRDLYIEGLSSFVLEELETNLKNLTLKFKLTIPCVYSTGKYKLDGKLLKIIPLRGNGSFWVESKNLTVGVKASMITEEDHLQLADDFNVLMDFDKVQMDLENLLGGGKWTEILIQILNDVSKDLFRKVLPLLKDELNNGLLKVINQQLKKLPIKKIIPGSSANEYVDQILENVREFIKDNNYDPMDLPDYSTNFSKDMLLVTMYGEAKLYDGRLSGISSIRRTDDCVLNATSQKISVSAHLGLQDLELHYKGHAKFMSFGPSIQAGGTIAQVAFYFQIEQSNARGAKPELQDLQIIELSTIWIKLTGLGPLTWVMQWLLTGITKFVEDVIIDKVTVYMRGYLEEELLKLSFPV